jgi:hypothetical protein
VITSTSEPVVELVNREFLILGDFKWILTRSNALCNGGKFFEFNNFELMFPIVGFLA